MTPTLLLALTVIVGAMIRFPRVGYGLPYPVFWDEPVVVNSGLRMMGDGSLIPGSFIYGSFPIYLSFFASIFAFLRASATGAAATLQAFTAQSPSPDVSISMTTAAPEAYLASRILFASLGLATIVVVYLIVRQLGFRLAGLFGSALIAVSSLHVAYSTIATVDVIGCLVTAVALIPALRILSGTATRRWYLASGAISGLAIATKLTLGPICVLLPLAHFLSDRQGRSTRNLVAGLLLVPLAFLGAEPGALLNLSQFLADTGNSAYAYGFAGLQTGAVAPGWEALTHYFVDVVKGSSHAGLGSVAGLLAGLGALYLAAKEWRRLIILLAFPIAYLALMSQQVLYFERNALVLVPIGAVLASVGLATILRAAGFDRKVGIALPPLVRTLAIGAVATGVVVWTIGLPAIREVDESSRMLAATDNRERAVHWLIGNALPGSRVAVTMRLPFHVPSLERNGFVPVWFDPRTVFTGSQDPQIDFAISSESLTSGGPVQLIMQLPGPRVEMVPLFSPEVSVYAVSGNSRLLTALLGMTMVRVQAVTAPILVTDQGWQTIEPSAVNDGNRPFFVKPLRPVDGASELANNGLARYGPLVPTGRRLQIRVDAAGSFGGGRYPIMVVLIQSMADPTHLDWKTIRLRPWRTQQMVAFDVAPNDAINVFAVFTDDFYRPGEGDRNVYIYRVEAMSG